jgi:apolipoprotein N-acyltransferase
VSLAAVVSACLPAVLAGSRRPWIIVAAALALPLTAWAGGALRLGLTAEPGPTDGVGLRIVQSNIPQREKWAARYQERNLRLFLDLSLLDRPAWITHVIWPETAATFLPGDSPSLRRILAAAVPPGGLLITGAPRRTGTGARLANAMVAIDGAGHIAARYDKHHLVPFGEYVPFADYLPIEKITPGRSGFAPGPGPRTLRLRGLPPFSPLICYEVIFPGEVAPEDDRPAWLLNLTNDAWYGISAGPHQHLAQSRVRAVEEGVPLVRAAYTGISAVIDPFGRVLQRRALNEAGVIDTRLPKPLADAPPYARWRDLPFWTIMLLFGATILLTMRNNQKGK